ncbi:Synaptophysin-like protein 1 [Halotydeus destructor]|nr:Synaptophysin-like protein 1 [Halotydeus destructor]
MQQPMGMENVPGVGVDPNAVPSGPGQPIVVMGYPVNTLVMKEPKGMIRAIQVAFALLCFLAVTGFETDSKMEVTCAPQARGGTGSKSAVSYKIEYPFNFKETSIWERYNCTKDVPSIKQTFPIDFSGSAQLYVTTGVLSFLYAGAALGFYLVKTQHYESNPLLPVIDLGITALFTFFWLLGTLFWAVNVSDLKYYTNPKYLKKHIFICQATSGVDCSTLDIGNWAALNISLVFGFANIFIWGMSCWFIFKETSFHQKNIPQDQMGAPPPTGFETYGQQPAQQYAPPTQQYAPQGQQYGGY